MSTARGTRRPAPARTALEAIAADITQRVRETREKINELEKSRAALAALIDSRIKNGALYGAAYPAEAREVDQAELARRDAELEDLVQMAGVLQLELRRLDRELALVAMTEHVAELERVNASVGPIAADLIHTWSHFLDLVGEMVELSEAHHRTRNAHKQDAENFEREYGESCAMLPGGTIPHDADLPFDIFEMWERAREAFRGMPVPNIRQKYSLSLADHPLLKQYAVEKNQGQKGGTLRAEPAASAASSRAANVPPKQESGSVEES